MVLIVECFSFSMPLPIRKGSLMERVNWPAVGLSSKCNFIPGKNKKACAGRLSSAGHRLVLYNKKALLLQLYTDKVLYGWQGGERVGIRNGIDGFAFCQRCSCEVELGDARAGELV